jgi:uncharacterized delta-60 repeat protein
MTAAANVSRTAGVPASRRVAAIVGVALGLAFPTLASGAAGDLDPTFGVGGKVVTDLGPVAAGAYGVATLPDGKIVVAGETRETFADAHVLLARYTADGSLDNGFGSGGSVTSTFGAPFEGASALALQPDGKPVIAGRSGETVTGGDFLVARYNPDGSLDSGFGQGGHVLTDFGSDADRARAVAIQPDGKIVAVGQTTVGGTNDFAVSRYGADGAADAGFGVGGKVVTSFGPDSGDSAAAVALQADGKIVVAGGSFAGATGRFAIARYTASGALDTTFNGDGRLLFGVGSRSSAQAIAVQPDGRIVVAGYGETSGIQGFALIRLTADGSIDSDFGAIGTMFGTSDAFAVAVTIQQDGKIVAAGHTEAGGVPGDFAIARYRADGSSDTSFGTSGKLVTDFGGSDFATSMAIQEDGRVVAAGSSDGDVALSRYLGDGQQDEDNDGIPDAQDPDTVALVVSDLPDSAFANGEHRGPFLNRLDAIEQLIAAGDVDQAQSELENLRRKVDGCGTVADTNDWIVDCEGQQRVRALIDELLANLAT